jgi:hypothetical protein
MDFLFLIGALVSSSRDFYRIRGLPGRNRHAYKRHVRQALPATALYNPYRNDNSIPMDFYRITGLTTRSNTLLFHQ